MRSHHGLAADLPLTQDEDVLDTWFSSALWTFSTLGWPDNTDDLKTFHSTDLMVTCHDIITFWVSRMIMMSLKFMDQVPFHQVYIHGLVTDADGQKMSKSKGNGLDPLDIVDGISLDDLVKKRTANLLQPKMAQRIEKATRKEFPEGIKAYGTDPLRFTFYSIASSARTVRFDMNRVEGYRNFCNKLWNAANFVFMNTQDQSITGTLELSVIDRWIISAFQDTAAAVNLAMETYRFDLAAKAIYEFVWDEFCDWYLELTKPLLMATDVSLELQRGARHTLLSILEQTLRLAHPFIPFMTEEIWQQIPEAIRGRGETIMLEAFPEANASAYDREAEADIVWIKAIVAGTRNIRGEMDISYARPIPVLFANGSEQDQRRLDAYRPLLTFLIRPELLEWLNPGDQIPVSATQLVGEMQLLVPMSGLIDKDAELARLDKEIIRKKTEVERAESKINNPSFVDRAPVEVVQKEKDKVQELGHAIAQLQEQRDRIASL